MEKYLTPIQYQQYLHDKTYQAAMLQSRPSVMQVVIVVAIFIIAVLVWAAVQKRRDNQRHADDLRREVERHTQIPVIAQNSEKLANANDAAWAKVGGGRK